MKFYAVEFDQLFNVSKFHQTSTCAVQWFDYNHGFNTPWYETCGMILRNTEQL